MVVGVNDIVHTTRLTEKLERAVGNDFVGIHVCRRSGTALDHVDNEFTMQITCANFFSRFDNCVAYCSVEEA